MLWYKKKFDKNTVYRLVGGASLGLLFFAARSLTVVSHQRVFENQNEDALFLRDLLFGMPASVLLGLATSWAIINVVKSGALRWVAQIGQAVLYGVTVYFITL